MPTTEQADKVHASNELISTSFFVLYAAYVLTRIPLLWYNEAEYTEGYIFTLWSFTKELKWHPLYPGLMKGLSAIIDPILAGRIVSALSGLVTLIFLGRLAEKLYNRQTAIIASLLFITAPLVLLFSTRVLTESLFLAVSVGTVYYFFCSLDQESRWGMAGLVFFCGLTVLTRPEGFIFTSLIGISALNTIRKRKWKPLFFSCAGLASWLVFFLWWRLRPTGSTYVRVFNTSLNDLSLERFLTYLFSYIEAYPYALCYPIFLLAFYHVMVQAFQRRALWAWILVFLHVIWIGILCMHWAWTTRFLIVLATLALVEAASMLTSLQSRVSPRLWKALAFSVLVFSLIQSNVALYFGKQTFADIKDTALFIRNNSGQQRIFSDESFKVQYYLGRSILPYSVNTDFQPGDIITLHSFHTHLSNEVETLTKRYKLSLVYSAGSRTMPFLGCGPVEVFSGTNQPSLLQNRFRPQRFQSLVLQIVAKK